MAATTTIPELTDAYAAQFERDRAGLGGLGPLRDAAIARFRDTGVPGPRDESWRFTNLGRAMRNPFGGEMSPASDGAMSIAPWRLTDEPHYRVVFVDGHPVPALSDRDGLPQGVALETLAEAIDRDAGAIESMLEALDESECGGLAALNAAMMRAGVVLTVDDAVELDRPIHVLHVASAASAGVALHARTLVRVGANARATIIETFAGADDAEYWCNPVTGIIAGPGAAIGHVRLQREGDHGVHTGAVRLRLERDATYDAVTLSTGGRLARTEITGVLVGEGANCRIAGGVLVRGRQHGDITTDIAHRVPHCESRQIIRNVVDDRARSVFQGRILVAPDAQKTAADQSSRNLLLSDRAHADAKPELRIFADDVKCSHGATVGDLDRDSLFYLQSRGLNPDAARSLLIRAFVAELIEAAPVARAHLEAVIDGWLDGAGGERRAA